MRANDWARGFFPNFKNDSSAERQAVRTPFIKKVTELLLTPVSGVIDRIFMAISQWRWNRVYGHLYDREDFNIAFKTRRHVSKNHPNHYQKKILERYECRLIEFRNRFAQPTTHE
jgi:hypothetical protein